MIEQTAIQIYIKDLNEALESCSDDSTLKDFQKLMLLEDKFAKRLRSVSGGKKVYRLFIDMILREKENLITARKYFREREIVYKEFVYPSIRAKEPSGLHKIRINFLFCVFAMKNLEAADAKLNGLFEEIRQLRESLINRHLHYALNRAKAFNTGANSNVDFSDLIQLANEALVNSVDKYVIDGTASSFRTMAIGRMVANLMASSDQALPVSFGGQASRQLYKIKKLLEKNSDLKVRDLSEIIGIAEEEIAALMNATSYSSLDAELDQEDGFGNSVSLRDFLPAPSGDFNDPHVLAEMKDLVERSYEIFQTLTVLEQKILKLKGVNFEKYF
jgi:DNA-directed RNA polymerase specialized sigma subunit